MESEFQILCSTDEACPEVKKVLEELGFASIKDWRNSPSVDISAKFELENDWQKEEIAQKIFRRCKEKVRTIQITTVKG